MVPRVWCLVVLSFTLLGCNSPGTAASRRRGHRRGRRRSSDRADTEPGQWLSHGRTYGEQRFSPLEQINRQTVGELGLTWFADLDTRRGQEATPLVADGVLYVSTAWSKVNAYRRGDRPSALVLRSRGAGRVGRQRVLRRRQSRRRVVGRQGVRRLARRPADRARRGDGTRALGRQHHRPHEAVHDHRRAARRQRQGADRQRRRRVRRARLRLGLRRRHRRARLALLYRARQSGRRLRERGDARWPPRRGAASGGRSAAAAPCGTRWPTIPSSICSISASATARRGTMGCAARAQGDNLFLASIVALDPDDGSYVWHYQTSPGETWDHTATQQIIVADLTINGDAAARRHAGAEERLLLRPRCEDRRVHLGGTVHGDQLGHARRQGDGPARRDAASALLSNGTTVHVAATAERRAHVALDVVQPRHGPRLHSDPHAGVHLQRRARVRAGEPHVQHSAFAEVPRLPIRQCDKRRRRRP